MTFSQGTLKETEREPRGKDTDMKKPTPTQTERSFNFDELFFSTTNERGIIQFGNDVFVRLSGYPKESLCGSPHSIIRHPDMPRAVFKLFWTTIQVGESIAAYVKNLAADGSFYWVFAFAFPIKGGYLSVRIKPSSSFFQIAKSIYDAVLEVEKESDLESSYKFLIDQILKAGFKSYSDFMVQAAFAELNLVDEKKQATPEQPVHGTALEISNLSYQTSHDLKDYFRRIQSFQKSNQSFIAVMQELSEAFQRLKYIALNMNISAAKFKEHGLSLGVIAKEFSMLSGQIQNDLGYLENFVDIVSTGVQKSALGVVSLDMQMLMVDFFIRESVKKMEISEDAFSDMLLNRQNFSYLFQKHAADLTSEISALEKHLDSVIRLMSDVRKLTAGLAIIRQIGAVESARDNDVRQTFVYYLEEMENFIHLLHSATQKTQKEMQEMKAHCHYISQSANGLSGRVDTIFDLASKQTILGPKGVIQIGS